MIIFNEVNAGGLPGSARATTLFNLATSIILSSLALPRLTEPSRDQGAAARLEPCL